MMMEITTCHIAPLIIGLLLGFALGGFMIGYTFKLKEKREGELLTTKDKKEIKRFIKKSNEVRPLEEKREGAKKC